MTAGPAIDSLVILLNSVGLSFWLYQSFFSLLSSLAQRLPSTKSLPALPYRLSKATPFLVLSAWIVWIPAIPHIHPFTNGEFFWVLGNLCFFFPGHPLWMAGPETWKRANAFKATVTWAGRPIRGVSSRGVEEPIYNFQTSEFFARVGAVVGVTGAAIHFGDAIRNI